jgi:hypothetical protein
VLPAPQALVERAPRGVGESGESLIVSHCLYKYQRML